MRRSVGAKSLIDAHAPSWPEPATTAIAIDAIRQGVCDGEGIRSAARVTEHAEAIDAERVGSCRELGRIVLDAIPAAAR